MVQLQARQLALHLHSPTTSSLLVDPTSLSLALMHSDSSISLYPSLSPLSPSPASLRTLSIPPPSSAATFLTLRQNTNSTPRVVFIISSPLLGGSAVILRFFILNSTSSSFSKSRVICNQSDLTFDQNKYGVIFRINHGVAIKLVGSINVFAMYSISKAKIYVFAVKMAGDDDVDGATAVKLMKCAVIDCSLPVFSISVSLGFLILGEQTGVRVFPMRPLVKGRVKKCDDHLRRNHKDLNNAIDSDNQLHLSNVNGSGDLRGNTMVLSNGEVSSRGNHSDSGKLLSFS